MNELIHDPTASSGAWYDVFGGGYGQAWMYSSAGLHALIGGGDWNDGVYCGSRAVDCSSYPWNVSTNVGAWCVCDSL